VVFVALVFMNKKGGPEKPSPDATFSRHAPPSLTVPPAVASVVPPALPQLSRKAVIAARKKFTVAVVRFDALHEYGSGSDYARIRISNHSDKQLPVLTLRARRLDASGQLVSWSRGQISIPDLLPGETKEVDFYPPGHFPGVSEIVVDIESVIDPRDEEFFTELPARARGSDVSQRSVRSSSAILPSTGKQIAVIGTPADSVLEWRGKPLAISQVGTDDDGLLVEWQYSDQTYLMGRRSVGGVEVYRVIKVTTRR
jgi:hypothetical protein